MYNNSFQSLVKVYPGTSIDSLAKKITHTLLTHAPPNDKVTFSSQLQPLGDVHFDKRGGTATEGERDLYRLIGLGVFVLVIACINFINLSTALSTTRLKEVGIRKTVGASGGNIIMQLLTETIVVSALSTVLACALVRPILNLFANFVPPDISLHLFSVRTLLFLLGLLSVTAAFAGFYPATVLSSYSPSSAVRKSSALPTGNSGWLRKTFIIFQFVFSICFITGVIVMKSQLQFIREKDRGFTTDNIRMFWTNFDDTSNHPRVLAERIRQITGVAQVSVHGGSPMGFATFMNNVSLSENKERVLDVVLKSGDANYIPLYGIRMQAGRNIHQSDSLREFVVNETLVHALGFDKPEDALGHHLNYFGKDYPIVGVVADFHQQSFHGPIPPIAIGNITGVQHGLAFKLDDNAVHANVVSVINKIEKVFKEIYPDDTFQPHLVEEEIGWMHQDDTRLAKLIDVAAAATVFISALGVFGLVMFTSQTRVKEIAIRKVLGASVSSIASMLAREFAILLAAANVFAIPVAWYTMDKWLATFSYRVHLSATMFLTATLLAFFVGLITVCYHTLKSALAPPVTSLRTD